MKVADDNDARHSEFCGSPVGQGPLIREGISQLAGRASATLAPIAPDDADLHRRRRQLLEAVAGRRISSGT